MDDTSDEKFGISVSKPETSLQDTTPETTVSLNEKEVEGEVKERKEESDKQEKESGIYNFKTDLQISHRMSTARLGRELQKWEPADDEDDEAECLEEEGDDWKEQTIFSAEEMFKLNASVGVQSTFLEDLSQYTTKLDISSLSREQIDFAEKMANEIMKENKQRKNKQRRRNKKQKK